MKYFYQKRLTMYTLLSLLMPLGAHATSGIHYNLNTNNKTATVSSYSGDSGDVVIPSSIISNGITYSVTGINKNAFKECQLLTSVTLPNSITTIGEAAFLNCI